MMAEKIAHLLPTLACAGVMLGLLWYWLLLMTDRADFNVRTWATGSALRILRLRRESRRGGRVTYRFVVEDVEGRLRRGWATVDARGLDPRGDRVEVRWEWDAVRARAPTSPRDDPLWDEGLDGGLPH